ncbi:MAG: histidine kinase [Spirochaetales bacterium]|nr:histidine kinase [Candidatus Physcosoma equi]
MSNRLLKKVLSDLNSCPESELQNLISQTLEEEDVLRELFDNSADGHVVINADNTIVFCNKKVFSMIPYRRKFTNPEGHTLKECIQDADLTNFILSVLNGSTKPEARDFTFQFGQEYRTLRVNFIRFSTENKAYVDVRLVDISEDIRKETRLRRTESLASMTTMAAGVAHEIKNPLAAMTIHTQLMRKAFQKFGSMDLEKAERYLSVIEEETEHLNKIAVDFLFAVKPMDVELKLASLNEIIEELASFLEPEAEEKNISVHLDLDKFLPRIELDSRLVKQALLNIIQNAFAAMTDGGSLTITSKHVGDSIALKITDTGTGIPEDKLSRIFEPYYTTKASRTGLGLTVVFKIMKSHNGDIHVESEVGKGTSFILSFPVPVSERKAIGETL